MKLVPKQDEVVRTIIMTIEDGPVLPGYTYTSGKVGPPRKAHQVRAVQTDGGKWHISVRYYAIKKDGERAMQGHGSWYGSDIEEIPELVVVVDAFLAEARIFYEEVETEADRFVEMKRIEEELGR